MEKKQIRQGALVKDRSKVGNLRVIRLEYRVNPMGDTPPYWQVKNVDTGQKSTIRENRLLQPRWVHVPQV